MNNIENDLVSIIMPLYNSEEYLSNSIESVLNQTYLNWELIIINDCSKDNSLKIAIDYSFKDKRIIILNNEKNLGAALSRNKGIKAAKGKYIAFLDSDDIWLKDKLSKQIAFMKKNNYYFSSTFYYVKDKNYYLVKCPKIINNYLMLRCCYVGCLTIVFDCGKLEKIEIPDIKKNNDWAMWITLSQKTNCYCLEEPLAIYNKRDGSISNVSIYTKIKYQFYLYKNVKKYWTLFSFIMALRSSFFQFMKNVKYKKKVGNIKNE